MADRDQLPDPKQQQHQQGPRREMAGQARGKQHSADHQPIVGEEVADHSKEKRTEIAVEAGKRGH